MKNSSQPNPYPATGGIPFGDLSSAKAHFELVDAGAQGLPPATLARLSDGSVTKIRAVVARPRPEIVDQQAAEDVGGGGGNGPSALAPAAADPVRRIRLLLDGRYRWVVLLAICGMVAGGLLGFRQGDKLYRSASQIRVMPVLPKALSFTEDNGMMPSFDAFVESQASLLRGQRVIERALEDPNWAKIRDFPTGDRAIIRLSRSLQITTQGEMVTVSVTDPNPEVAVLAVNKLVEAYLKFYVEEDRKQDGRMDLLDRRRSTLQAEVDRVKANILAVAKVHGTEDLSIIAKPLAENLNKLQQTIKETELALEQSDPAKASEAVARELTVSEISYRDEEVHTQLAKKREQTAILEVQERVAGLMPEHPEVKRIKARLEIAERDLQAAVTRFREAQKAADKKLAVGEPNLSQRVTPEAVRERLATFKKMAVDAQGELLQLRENSLRIADYKEELAQWKEKLAETLKRIDQLKVEAELIGNKGRIQVTAPAERPLEPAKDSRPGLAVAGGFGGAILGFGLVLGLAFCDRRLRSPGDAEMAVDFGPMLGMLPTLADDASGSEEAAVAAHMVNQIRAMLQISCRDQKSRVLAVTSPRSGTGKTSLTLALGVSFAATRARTLLIDCDVVGGGLTSRLQTVLRPRIGKVLLDSGLIQPSELRDALAEATRARRRLGEVLVSGKYVTEADLERALAAQEVERVGLLSALAGEDLERCIAETEIPGLYVLPLGDALPQHAGILSPTTLRRVIDAASALFDTVLIDTGPVPGSLEASVVAAVVDGVILAVSSGENRGATARCAAQLNSVGARVAGLVFNRASPHDLARSGSPTRSGSLSRGSGAVRSAAEGITGDIAARFGPLARAVATFAPLGHKRNKAN